MFFIRLFIISLICNSVMISTLHGAKVDLKMSNDKLSRQCEGLNQEDCRINSDCEWITQIDPNGDMQEFCIDSNTFNDDGGLSEECYELENTLDCLSAGCEWSQTEGCFNPDDSEEEHFEDECRYFENEEECLTAGCEWSDDGCYGNWNDEEEDHGDGPPECLLDCEGIEYINPGENPYETCDWIISNFGPNNFMNSCAEDCDDETMMEINEYMELCFQCLADNNCDDIFNDEDEEDEEGECSLITNPFECFAIGCEWVGGNLPGVGYCTDGANDDGGWQDDGGDDGNTEDCFGLSQDECVENENCDWVSNDPSGNFGICIEFDGNDDGGWQDDGGWDSSCSDLLQDECTENPECDWSVVVTPNGIFEICIESNGLDDGGWQDDGGDDGDDYECSDLGYEDCEYLDFCEWISDSDNPNSMGFCIDAGGPSPCSDFNEEDCNWFDECIWTDQGCQDYNWDEECDSTLICGEAITCWDNGLLYPTTCGPENCDEPIGECDDNDDCVDSDSSLAYLELEDVIGYQGNEVVVPMYLRSSQSVGGVQFKLFNSVGAVPAGINSLNDCFTANYNDSEEAYIGIVFSLEGCSYPANEETHIVDLIFEISPYVPIGVDLELDFDYTIVADSDGIEVPSCGIGSSIQVGMLGDVNSDGEINVLDVVSMVSFALESDYPNDIEFWSSDINGDGTINVLDVVQLVSTILNG